MRILMVEDDPQLALQEILAREGNEVMLWFTDKPETVEFDPPPVDNIRFVNGPLDKAIEQADLVFAPTWNIMKQSTRMKRLEVAVRKEGKNRGRPLPFIGPNYQFAQLETDRLKGRAVAESSGLFKTVPTHLISSFSHFKKLINSGTSYVLKDPKERQILSTTLGMSSQDMLDWGTKNKASITEWMLEEKVSGYETGIGGWFDGHNFVNDAILIDQEQKGVMEGDQGGILCGQAGTAGCVYDYYALPSKVARIVDFMAQMARQYCYKGFFNVNVVFSGKDVYFLEWTARIGVPTEIESSYYVNSYTALLSDVANLTFRHCRFDKTNKFAFSSLLNWGMEQEGWKESSHLIELNINKDALQKLGAFHAPLVDARYHNGKLYHLGYDVAYHVGTKGPTMKIANEKLQEALKHVSSYNGYFRKDTTAKWNPIWSVV